MNSVILMKATFYRNVKDYKFSHKLTNEQKQEILNRILSVLGNEYELLSIDKANDGIIKYLTQNSLISNNSNTFILSKNETSCVEMFNGEHISIISTGKDCFGNANRIADLIQNKICLNYTDELGYVMSNLNNIGAGIKLECDMCLDAICGINKLEQVKQNISMLGYSLVPTNIKSIYKISTKCSLGFSETEVYDNFIKTIKKLQELEIESAKMLDISSHDEIIDNVFRSYAILNSAHIINIEELTKHLIILRTGLNLGFINISLDVINKLQKLVSNKTTMLSKSECVELANNVKTIIKGDKNV